MSTEPLYKTLIVEHDGPVCRVTINRPEQLNALSPLVFEELQEVLFGGTLEVQSTRVLVLQGSGQKAFVAGADISAMQNLSPDEARAFARHGQLLTKGLETLNIVTVAKVQGYALGGGCELAMACDLIIAGRSAKFGQPEVNLGLIPGFGGTQRLVRRVGMHVALDMLLCGRGRSLSGTEAHQLGLVSRVVDDDKLDAEVQKVIASLLAAGPQAIADCKRLVRDSYNMNLDAGLSAEATNFAHCFAGEEAQEGMTAFLEKRAPEFTL
jgi:enoyl-CoA hydratase